MARLKSLKPRLQTLKPSIQLTTCQPKSTRGQGRGGRPWRRKREQIFKRDNYTCQACKRVGSPQTGKLSSLELDHIVNIASGGSNSDDNLQTLCHECHSKKTLKESQTPKIY